MVTNYKLENAVPEASDFFVDEGDWVRTEEMIRGYWKEQSVEHLVTALGNDGVRRYERSLRRILHDWLKSDSDALLSSPIAALNAVCLLEWLLLDNPEDEDIRALLFSFRIHPIREVGELATLAYCQVEDILKLSKLDIKDRQAASLREAFKRWSVLSN